MVHDFLPICTSEMLVYQGFTLGIERNLERCELLPIVSALMKICRTQLYYMVCISASSRMLLFIAKDEKGNEIAEKLARVGSTLNFP